MSNDKDSKDPGPEDDGWGAAASESEAASEAPAPAADVDFDPVHVKERVAAMHAKAEATSHGEADDTPSQVEAPAVASPSSQVEAPAVASPPSQVEAPAVASPPAATPILAPIPTVASGAAPVMAPVTVDDKPQWIDTDPSAPALSSDMLVAADALDAMKDQPAAKKRRKREQRLKKDPKTQLTRRQQFFLVGGAALLVVSAVCAVLGWLNSKNYYLVCGKRSITAEQGSFWPYGRSPLPGEAFKAIPGTHECASRHFESREELERAFLTALIEQATRLLTSGDAEQVAAAEQGLQQALLLSRDPERGEERAMAERLQGDVAYWRGAAEIQGALETLRNSANYFEEAATRRPRHSNDANAWAEHARFISSEIDKGPRTLRKDESAKEEPHFQGLSNPDTPAETTDPAEPDAPQTPVEPVAVPIDAGVDARPPAVPVDAALPTGGVLL